jgi:hypothetical protein
MSKLNRFVFLLIAVMASSLCFAEAPDRLLSLSHPSIKWMLQVELPNAVEEYNNYKEGAGSYAHGRTMDERILFSMAMHKYPGATDAKSCRDVELVNTRKNALMANFKFEPSESGEVAYLRTSGTVQMEGRSMFRQSVHRYVFRDGLCAKAHLSSGVEGAAVGNELTQAVDTMNVKDATIEITRAFHSPPKGALRVAMPRHWGFQTSNPIGAPGRTITVITPDGQFQFMITLFPAPAEQKEPAETVTRKSVEDARVRAQSEAAQSQIDIVRLKGRSAEGHYIFVTDKSLVGKPAVPNNWKHIRQGMLKAGAVFATFTVFSNDENSPDALQAMRALERVEFATE